MENILSHDVTSGSDIKPCVKLDKLLFVYVLVMLFNDVHKNITYIMTNLNIFMPKM